MVGERGGHSSHTSHSPPRTPHTSHSPPRTPHTSRSPPRTLTLPHSPSPTYTPTPGRPAEVKQVVILNARYKVHAGTTRVRFYTRQAKPKSLFLVPPKWYIQSTLRPFISKNVFPMDRPTNVKGYDSLFYENSPNISIKSKHLVDYQGINFMILK